MSETCEICGEKVEYTCTISVPSKGKTSKAMCMKCMKKIPELIRRKTEEEIRKKEKENEQMEISKKS